MPGLLGKQGICSAYPCAWRIVISPMIPQDFPPCYYSSMRNLAVLVIHLIATLARFLGPGGVRSLVAESLLLKHQLLIVNRSRQRSPNLSAGDRHRHHGPVARTGPFRSVVAESLLLKHELLIVNRSRQRSPNLSASDRILAGVLALLVHPTRLLRSAIALKPSTLLPLHKALRKQKYRMLFSPNQLQVGDEARGSPPVGQNGFEKCKLSKRKRRRKESSSW
jgi:hypothetical protein